MSFNILQSQGPFKNCLILLFWGIKNFTNFFTGTRIFTDGMPVYRWYGKFSKLATLTLTHPKSSDGCGSIHDHHTSLQDLT